MSKKVALIFVFNHRYDKNIPVLEKIYKDRFSNIYHLVPFYDGDRLNVIPVYENSFYFQGYIAQGLQHYFAEEFVHYLFVADDLILNPSINEDNYAEYFKLSPTTSFIPEIFQLHHLSNNNTLRFEKFNNIRGQLNKLYWWRIKDVVNYQHKKEGVETRNEMPGFEEAEAIFKKHGYFVKPLTYLDAYGGLFPMSLKTHEKRMKAARFLYHVKSHRRKYRLSYPLVGAYSDLVIVAQSSIKKFCHYCGVFAANELFVEFAVPSALLLASDEVVTEPVLGKRGDIYWTYTQEEAANYDSEMQVFHYKLRELLLHFPKDKLYIHPIKLSKWNTQQE